MAIVPLNPSREAPESSRPLPPARHRMRQPEPATVEATGAGSDLKKIPNYAVGYGKPPIHSRFKPGKSGNPRGRPKEARGLKTLARELLTARVPVRTGSGEKKMHRIEAVLHKTFELALKGDARALSQVLSLYASAVPETAPANAPLPAEELSSIDLAILEELKDILLRGAHQ